MPDSDKKLTDETPEKKPLNISDLAMNPCGLAWIVGPMIKSAVA